MKLVEFSPSKFKLPDLFSAVEPRALTSALFSDTNPFWQKGRALLVWDDAAESRVVGFVHADFIADNECYSTFGYWQPSKDAQLNQKMLETVEDWASNCGVKKMLGPIQFKTCYDYRFRLDQFERPAFWGEPKNESYPVEILQNLKWQLSKKYFTDCIIDLNRVKKIGEKKLPAMLGDFDEVQFIPFNQGTWLKNESKVLDLANQIFKSNYAYSDLDKFDFELLYSSQVLQTIHEPSSFFVTNRSGALIGFSFGFADPNNPQRLLIKTTGVLPEYRHGGKTFVACLMRMFEMSSEFDEMAFCLMAEDNQVHRLTKKYSQMTHTYGLFEKRLGSELREFEA